MKLGYEKITGLELLDTATQNQHMAPLIIGHGTDNVSKWT